MASPFVPVDLDKLLDEFEEKEEGECPVVLHCRDVHCKCSYGE